MTAVAPNCCDIILTGLSAPPYPTHLVEVVLHRLDLRVIGGDPEPHQPKGRRQSVDYVNSDFATQLLLLLKAQEKTSIFNLPRCTGDISIAKHRVQEVA